MNALAFLVNGIVFLAQFVFLLRFLLQASRADFYNPISQGISTATDVVLAPLRKLIPPYRNFDFAAFVVAWLITVGGTMLNHAMMGWPQPTAAGLALGGLMKCVQGIIMMYIWFILIMVIASFVAPGNYNPALNLLRQITEPLMAPARRLIPPLGMLDLSPMVVLMLLYALNIALSDAFL